MNYVGLIVAAGLSSRMNEFKPLMEAGDTTFIGSVIEKFRTVGVGDIVVVTGHRAEELEAYLEPLGVRTVRNERYAETKMFDSVRIGLEALGDGYDYLLFSPGDVPFVSPDTVHAVFNAEGALVRPVCESRVGHPVKIAAALVPEILNYSGERGLRGAMESLPIPIVELEVEDEGSVTDIDTPEDLKGIQKRLCD